MEAAETKELQARFAEWADSNRKQNCKQDSLNEQTHFNVNNDANYFVSQYT